MKKTAIILMLISILSKILGFVRDISLSYFFGATNITDAYLISITIPSVIFGFIGTGISTGYIPMYSKINEDEGDLSSNKYTNNLINVLIIITLILFIFGQIFTGQLVRVFASGFEGQTLNLAIKFTRIGLAGMFFTGLISILTGYLRIKGSYVIPALIGLPLNIVTILAIVIASKGNYHVLPLGIFLAALAQLLFIVPDLRRKSYTYKFILDLKDKHVRNMFYIALPVIAGTSVDQINVLVDRTIASTIASGAISSLNYANKLNGFVQGVFVSSIVVVLYPMISKMVAEKNIDGLKKSVSEAINSINLLVIPATIGMIFFAQPIVVLLFGRGQFDENAIVMTTSALFFYAIGIVGFALRDVLSRTFYSLQDTKTPAINATIAVIINIVLNIILSKYLGVGGLALATSISAIICTGLLFVSLRKKIGPFGFKNIAINFIKILLASLGMGLIARMGFGIFIGYLSPSVSLILAIGLGAISYGAIILFMRIEDVDKIIRILKSKLGRG